MAAILISLAVLTSGCRDGSTVKQGSKALSHDDAATSHVDRDERQAYSPSAEQEGADGDVNAPSKSVPEILAADLRFIPDYALAVGVMRPAKLLELPGVKNIPGADLAGDNPMQPSDVDRVVFTVLPDGGKCIDCGGAGSLTCGFVVEFSIDAPQTQLIKRLSPGAQRWKGSEEVYLPTEVSYEQLSLAFPDQRTMVAAYGTRALFEMLNLAKRDMADTRLLQAYRQIDPQAQFTGAVDVDRLRHFFDLLHTGVDTNPKSDAWTSLLLQLSHRTKTARLSWDLSRNDGFLLSINTDGDNTIANEEAQHLSDAMRATVQLIAKNLVEELGADQQPRIESTAQVIADFVSGLAIDIKGPSAMLAGSDPPPPADILQTLAETLAFHVAVEQKKLATFQTALKITHIGLAIHNFYDVHGRFPQDIKSADGTPMLSWRVELLPFFEQFAISDANRIYQELRLDEPWDSPHNRRVGAQMPDLYRTRDSAAEADVTHFLAVSGKGTVFGDGIERFDDVIDGTENTLAVIETDRPVLWTKPEDFEFNPAQPHRGLRPGGSLGLMYNGVRVQLSAKTDAALIRQACLYDDGGRFDPKSIAWRRSGVYIDDPEPVNSINVAEVVATLRSGSREEKRRTLYDLAEASQLRKQRGAQQVIDQLGTMMATDDPNLRLWVLTTLAKWSNRERLNVAALLPLLRDPYEQIRWLTISLLGRTGRSEVVRPLLTGPHADAVVRWDILNGRLQKVAADAAVPALQSDDVEERVIACYLIANTGNKSHLPHLRRLLTDKEEPCRKAAETAIQLLESPTQ